MKQYTPINNQIEPDFLQFIKDTFKRWEEITAQGTAIGTRELSNFAFVLKGAAMNSHIGFVYNFNPRGESEAGALAIQLSIYTDKTQHLNGCPAMFFELEI